jgi:hypothetical protein
MQHQQQQLQQQQQQSTWHAVRPRRLASQALSYVSASFVI